MFSRSDFQGDRFQLKLSLRFPVNERDMHLAGRNDAERHSRDGVYWLRQPKEGSLPIRLMQTPTTCGVRPFAGIERGVGWRLSAARDAKQRSERVKRIEASIEAERELVEIGL